MCQRWNGDPPRPALPPPGATHLQAAPHQAPGTNFSTSDLAVVVGGPGREEAPRRSRECLFFKPDCEATRAVAGDRRVCMRVRVCVRVEEPQTVCVRDQRRAGPS